MKNKLHNPNDNSGVGISVGVSNKKYFNPKAEYVLLYFGDGTVGQARVKKKSWDDCTHLINTCIGKWTRQNGLWKQKLKKSTVPVFLRARKPFKEFKVSK